MNPYTIKDIEKRHLQWLEGHPEGERINWEDYVLKGAVGCGKNLSDAIFRNARIKGAFCAGDVNKNTDFSGLTCEGFHGSSSDFTGANFAFARLGDRVNFQSANLTGCNFYGVDTSNFMLRGCTPDGEWIKKSCVMIDDQPVLYTTNTISIFCYHFHMEDWLSMGDDEMLYRLFHLPNFPYYWKRNKDALFADIESNPARKSGL